jgi:osmotically-inducible protein OsmY
MSDQSLVRAVMQALADTRHVQPDEIAAQADGGRVVLRGTVGSPVQEAEAVRSVERVAGVSMVENRLRIRPTALEAREDVDTEAAVLAALIDDGGVPASSIDVDADHGTVTLSGLVDRAAQRDRAERVARSVGGVTSVHNELRLPPVADANEIAERITNALGVDALVGIDRVGVSVDEGDVTLTGTVRSDAHRAIAVTIAGRIPGVAHVHDHLSVDRQD